MLQRLEQRHVVVPGHVVALPARCGVGLRVDAQALEHDAAAGGPFGRRVRHAQVSSTRVPAPPYSRARGGEVVTFTGSWVIVGGPSPP